MNRCLAYICLFALLSAMAFAEKHVKLLAVSESDDMEKGMVADLYLEVKPGTGRVFIDTYPLTKIDTQISTRFARSVACSYLDVDCSRMDFFYTLRSNAAIVGGPSAGAALTLITIAAIEDYKVDENIAVSGTINSGGLIGPVGSLPAKIDAAVENNMTLVLIPKGSRMFKVEKNGTNQTIDLMDYGSKRGINVKEVATVDDVLYEFTGKRDGIQFKDVRHEPEYDRIMSGISKELCDRTSALKKEIRQKNSTLYEGAQNLTKAAESANGSPYSQASYCFGANIKLSNEILMETDISGKELSMMADELEEEIISFKGSVDGRKISTVNDMQAYNVVMERLNEALENCNRTREAEELEDAYHYYAYAKERFESGRSWSRFFESSSPSLTVDEDSLRASCAALLTEAEERYQYVQLYMPKKIKETRIQLNSAYSDLDAGRYSPCIFKATKSKAEADVVLGALGIGDDDLPGYLDSQLSLVGGEIAAQQDKGYFPLLGYSYYEYANTLKETDTYSALIYAEYALELSNLDHYFSKPRKRAGLVVNWNLIMMFSFGIASGGLTVYLLRGQSKDEGHLRIKIKDRKPFRMKQKL
jgi:uncharacterized protein